MGLMLPGHTGSGRYFPKPSAPFNFSVPLEEFQICVDEAPFGTSHSITLLSSKLCLPGLHLNPLSVLLIG